MKQIRIHIYSIILVYTCSIIALQRYDVTVVGAINFADGLGRQPIGLIECIKNDATINFIHTQKCNLQDVPPSIHEIFNNPPGPSNVAILEDILSIGPKKNYKYVPQSTIKLAYTMFEATAILPEWVTALNKHFDAAVVPDPFLVSVYKNSGVKIPIFVLPLGVYIQEFLQQPLKIQAQSPFVFGCTNDFRPRKNYLLLLESFIEEFGNNPNVILKINGRRGQLHYKKLIRYLQQKNISNIQMNLQSLSWHEYLKLMKSFDCFVSLAKGEGFAITPREAMALGIPCILSNNTAHTTICISGYVLAVPSPIKQLASFPAMSPMPIGYNFNCHKHEVKNALRELYTNFEIYLAKTPQARSWVKQYQYSELKQKCLNLLKPKKVVLGPENKIEDEYLMTNSESLYNKYLSIISNSAAAK